ncbi:MAG: N-glycosylase [Clostridia bacterium]|nr:N-glycosylase [Clostridia bacterium]
MKFDFDAEYFNPLHTLDCGQVFRFYPYKEGFAVISADKACYVHSEGNKTVVESSDCDYFWHYFDLDRDYSEIVEKAKSFNIPLLSRSAEQCKGLRILNQNREEMIFSFIISQNNNIPRIKGIINRICEGLGERVDGKYYAFPKAKAIAEAGAEFFRSAGAGYRDVYLVETGARIAAEGIERLESLDAPALKAELLKYTGIGPKVADCVSLFGFGKMTSFPVDTWIEKIYREDFGGTLTNRDKISKYLVETFKEYSGYMQQYLFYGKRLNL